MVDVGGVFLAVLSAVFNGTFGTLSKIQRVQEAEVSKLMVSQRGQCCTKQLFSGGGVHTPQCTMACQSWHFDLLKARNTPSRDSKNLVVQPFEHFLMLPEQTPPPIFNLWMCCGILISSAPALAAGQVSHTSRLSPEDPSRMLTNPST